MIIRRARGPTSPPSLFIRGPATVSSSLSDSVAITDGDPVPDSPGAGGGIGSYRLLPPPPQSLTLFIYFKRITEENNRRKNRHETKLTKLQGAVR